MDPRSVLWYHIEVDQADAVRSLPERPCSQRIQTSNVFNVMRGTDVSLPPSWLMKTPRQQADPVKQRGPLALSELREVWAAGGVDRDTFVWCVLLCGMPPCVVSNHTRVRVTDNGRVHSHLVLN